jgi:teichuronic acid biosynthesis glycosyltransferase TuaG
MLTDPIVSIIMPTYNSQNYVSESIESIVNQTFAQWELIITDDCSTDNTMEIINKFKTIDSRIKVYALDENLGAGFARNNSIKMAKAKYIAFCDSDDQWIPKKLEQQLKFMSQHDLQFSFTDYKVIDDNGLPKGIVKCPEFLTFKQLLKNNYIGCLTVIYDSSKLGKLYMSEIRKRQDWVLWLRIMKKIKSTIGFNVPLSIYRDRSNSISSNKIKLLKYNWKVYNHELKFNNIKSAYYFFKFVFFYIQKKLL